MFLKYISDISELGMNGAKREEKKCSKIAFLVQNPNTKNRVLSFPIPGTNDSGFALLKELTTILYLENNNMLFQNLSEIFEI